jgi:hypothetical protein
MTTPFGEAIRRIRRERGQPGFDFLQRVAGYLNIIWDEADDLFRVAAISHPRVVVDTSGMPASYTAFANRLARQIRALRPETVRELGDVLERAARSGEKHR